MLLVGKHVRVFEKVFAETFFLVSVVSLSNQALKWNENARTEIAVTSAARRFPPDSDDSSVFPVCCFEPCTTEEVSNLASTLLG